MPEKLPAPGVYHVSVRVEAAVAYSDDLLRELFYGGAEGDISKVRTRLVVAQAKGYKRMTLREDCNHHDPKYGCLGHAAIELPLQF